MPKRRRPKKPRVVLTPDVRSELERYARGRTVSHALALRAQIILLSADGVGDAEIGDVLRISRLTAGRWRRSFLRRGVSGLCDLPRPNVHRRLQDERIEEVIRKTLETKPPGATHWSTRKLAKMAGVSQSSVSRIWRAFKLRPWRTGTFTLSNDDFFVEKVRDVVGLYMNPPDRAVVLCIDEKSQIQALNRTQPLLPMDFGQPERRTHTYVRHGTTNLFAALDCATGKVIGECFPKKRAIEFRKFLKTVDVNVPKQLDVHMVVDNSSIHAAPPVQRWLKAHPRFHVHFVPTYSSWLNLVERWFAKLTEEALRRGSHCSVRELQSAIQAFIDAGNDDPKPFVWTKSADDILASVARFCQRTLALAES